MMKLFQQDFKVNQWAHQSHLVYRVYVPENVLFLQIQFNYGPILETNKESITKAVLREGLDESLVQEDTTVRNLLTLSINDPDHFRGAHHYFSEKQEIQIGTEKATEGFMAGRIQEGFWEFIISCHGLFSEEVIGRIEVAGVSESEWIQKEETIPLQDLKLLQNLKDRTSKAQSYQTKRVELHSHTVHSDATQTTEELLTQAEKESIDWLAITDHNTVSAIPEAEAHNLYNKQLKVLKGIEFTTFYGHFLAHGPLKDINVDWTKLAKNDIQNFLQKLKEKNVYMTIAHPFDGGNPFCTGCRWEYILENLKYIDAIEVWNGTNPHDSLSNEDAFYKWTKVLEQGYEVSASCGRDWHQLYPDEAIAYTYALVPDHETEEDLLKSLILGRSYISLRPQIDFRINDFHILGDRVEDLSGDLNISLNIKDIEGGDEIRLYSQRDLIFQKKLSDELEWKEEFRLQNDGYSLLRVEILNEKKDRIAFTNPIYIHRNNEKG